MYHPLAMPMKHDNLLCLCQYCGNLYVSTEYMRCPVCNSGNIKNIPLRDHNGLTSSWVKHHGFILEDEQVVE